MPTLKITTDNLQIAVREGESLRDICDTHLTSILFGCFSARCGACRIRVLENPQGLSTPEDMEIELLNTLSCTPDERLACQARVVADVTISVVQSR